MASLLSIDESLCTHCNQCAAVCPMALVRVGKRGPRTVPDAEQRCILCGHCIAACPIKALQHTSLPEEETLPLAENWRGDPEAVKQLIQGRRSIRRYEDKPVDRAILENVLDMARYAPSGMNAQPVQWLVVYETAEVKKLAIAVVDWLRSLAEKGELVGGKYNPAPLIAGWDAGVDTILRGAPHVLIAHGPKENPMAHDACVAALTTAKLAAASQGLGTCRAGFLHLAAICSPEAKQAIHLPDDCEMHGALMIGYSQETYHRIPPRKPLTVDWR
ncbi:MAG: nitroreductase family protein [Phycisphaerae bacterium]|nr:nitroreductase family protein [Phycisphaerae bacterium]